METVNDIPNWRWTLYGYFCKDLLEIIQGLRNEIAGKNGLINSLKLEINVEKSRTKEWQERAMIQNKDAAIAVQVIKEQMRGGEMQCVLSAHENGSKMRIRELECDVAHLQKIIKELRNPIKKEQW